MILCKLGLHKWVHSEKWIPSIHAEIVTEYIFTGKCQKCGKVKFRHHGIWNGTEFEVNNAT